MNSAPYPTGRDADFGLDPMTAEVFRHALTSIPGQIDANIVRTAYSPLVYEYKDYAVGIVDHEGRLLSQARGALPIFVANALSVAVRDGLNIYGAQAFNPGDALVTNHAGTLGQHLNNVVMFSPIFVGPGQTDLFGFMAVLVHWIDVGGHQFGNPSQEIYEEGVQYRCLRLQRKGVVDLGVQATIRCNTRFPRELMGDVQAQLAGCLRGVELVQAVVEKYGVTTARAAVHRMWDRAEAGARAAIRDIPDGSYTADAYIDDDGNAGGKPTFLSVTIRVDGENMEVDFSKSADQVAGQINSGREGGAVAAARIAFKFLVEPNEPANYGVFRTLTVTVRDRTFLSADAEAPMAFYSQPLPTAIDLILRALAPAIPDRIVAGHHGTYGVHGFRGIDPRNGERFECFDTALGGWGAGPRNDGGGPFKTMAHGDTLDVPVEVQELLYPLQTASYAIRTDSGGAGTTRGGLGLVRTYVATARCTAFVVQDRECTPPWGLFDGLDGARPESYLIRNGQAPHRLRRSLIDLEPGDRIVAYSGGGGGFGDPLKRDPARVLADVEDGYVSATAASQVYGLSPKTVQDFLTANVLGHPKTQDSPIFK